MENLIKIGIAVKPQGVKGEVKIQPITDDINRFLSLKEVIIDGKTYSVLKARICTDFVLITFSGINDRNSAELFRGKFLCVDRKNAVPLKENRFFIEDLIDSYVYLNDELSGKVIDVTKAKTDYITVKKENGKIVRFPFLKKVLISFDAENKKLVLDKEEFIKVACYED